MKRLRHPIRAIEEPFGKAGLIVAVIALVLALTGAAFAATGLNGKQKKEVEKIAKKFAGKPGANGAPGAQGAAGAAGASGKDGANGTSATVESFSGKKTVGAVTCEEGGVAVKSASPETAVCNGKKGTTGFTETLPKGSTARGFYATSSVANGPVTEGVVNTGVSFVIPLAQPVTAVYVKPEATPPSECPGTAEEPAAEEGFLCVYGIEEENVNSLLGGVSVANPAPKLGFEVGGFAKEAGLMHIEGTWAVTAG